MPIDKATANGYMLDATNRVWAKWGNVIPSYYRVPPAGLFVMHTTEASIRAPFTNAWDSLFKKTVQSTQSAQDFPAPAGFVTPERNPSARKIHINLAGNEYDWVGMFAHEYIHWLSHENFPPIFFSSEPDKVEGATDYLTLKCFHGHDDALTNMQQYNTTCANRGVQKLKKAERAAYDWKGQFTNMRTWVKSNHPQNEAALADFVFNGVPVHFPY
jgi:hypothetical protein